MPDTSEGYAASSLLSSPNGSQTSASVGAMSPLGNVSAMPFSMQRPSVAHHGHAAVVSAAAARPGAAALYASYPVTETYHGAHSFGGGEPGACSMEAAAYPEAGARYHAYEAAGSPDPSQSGPGADGVPSIGSYAHLAGQCSRCCFHPKGRCANGFSCQFCHFDHDKRPRNGKKKRYRRHPDDGGEEMD